MSGFGGVTGGGKKVNNRSLGPGREYSIKGKVGAQRSVNKHDVRSNNTLQSTGITGSNAGGVQRPSILEKQYNKAYHNKNYCDHGCSHGSNVGSTGKNPMEMLGLGMNVASMMSSIFGPSMQRPQLTPTTPTTPIKSVSLNPGEIGSPVESVNGNVTSNMEEITNMQKATNSTDLRTAIGAADTELTNLNSNIPDLEQKAGEAKTKLEMDENKDGINDLARNIDLAEQKEAKFAKSVQSCENAKNQTLQVLENCKAQLSELGQNYIAAVNDVTTAETNLADLETQLANLPDNATDQRQILEGKITAAKTALNTAKTTRDDLAEQISELEDASEENKLHLKQMVKNHQDAIKGLEKAKSEHKDALEGLNRLKTDKTNWEQAIKDYKEAKKQINELTNAINSNKKRLIKLEEAEAKALEQVNKDIGELDKKNGKLLGKIDITDGYSRAEERRQERIQSNAPEIKSLTERKAQLEAQIKATINNNGNCIRGSAPGIASFKGALIGNKYYYLVGEKVYTAEQFDALKEEGQRLQNERLAKKNTSDV